MFALNRRRDFVHKRAQHGQVLAARANPSLPDQGNLKTPDVPPPTADPKATSSANPFSPVTPDPKTSNTPTPSNLATPSAAGSSPSSLSSTAPSASSSRSSSGTTAASTVSTPLTAASQTAPYLPLVTTHVVGVSYTPSTLSSTLSPSATPSAGSSGGSNTGAIVGGVAGTLAGIAVLGLLLMWCMRRQRDRDIDDFDTKAFKRQSAVLIDDPVEPSRSYNPRPPTMIERHNASPALAAQAGYGQNFYGSYGGYGQQPPYPPEMIQPAVSPPPQAYGAPSMGYAGYNDPQPQIVRQASAYDAQQQLARQPSNAGYLTRQAGSTAGYVPPPGSLDPNAQYIDLNRSSISPYQAAQYADISRQLGAAGVNAEVPPRPLELPEGPLPSPFDDPVEATVPSHAHLDHPSDMAVRVSAATAIASQTRENLPESHERPATVYEEGDAYGGI